MTQTARYAYSDGEFVGVHVGTQAQFDATGYTSGAAPVVDEVAIARAGMTLTFAQLLTGLETEGWITNAEFKAWLAGTLPTAVTTLIASFPANQQAAAEARALRPSVVLRTNPLVNALAAAEGKTATEIDDFFTTYGAI